MEAEYARALAELRARHSRVIAEARSIETAIVAIEQIAGVVPAIAPIRRRGRQPAFIPAVVELLQQGDGRLLTTQEIVDELQETGFVMGAKDPYRNAAALLRREIARPDAQIAKIGENQWMAVLQPER